MGIGFGPGSFKRQVFNVYKAASEVSFWYGKHWAHLMYRMEGDPLKKTLFALLFSFQAFGSGYCAAPWATQVNKDVVPAADSTYDVGSSSVAFAEGHFDEIRTTTIKDQSNQAFVVLSNAAGSATYDDAYQQANVTYDRSTVSLTADDTAVDVSGMNYIRMSSDDVTAANRTFTLTSAVDGQILYLNWNSANEGQLVDTGNVILNGNWEPTDIGETIVLLSQGGADWTEISRIDPVP
jgi:hypothetical protein